MSRNRPSPEIPKVTWVFHQPLCTGALHLPMLTCQLQVRDLHLPAAAFLTPCGLPKAPGPGRSHTGQGPRTWFKAQTSISGLDNIPWHTAARCRPPPVGFSLLFYQHCSLTQKTLSLPSTALEKTDHPPLPCLYGEQFLRQHLMPPPLLPGGMRAEACWAEHRASAAASGEPGSERQHSQAPPQEVSQEARTTLLLPPPRFCCHLCCHGSLLMSLP